MNSFLDTEEGEGTQVIPFAYKTKAYKNGTDSLNLNNKFQFRGQLVCRSQKNLSR